MKHIARKFDDEKKLQRKLSNLNDNDYDYWETIYDLRERASK